MSTGNGTIAPTVLTDGGPLSLPGRRFGWADWATVALCVVTVGVFAFVVDEGLPMTPVLALAVLQGLTDTVWARVVVTDDTVVDDQRFKRRTVPLAAVRWTRPVGGRVELGVEGNLRYGDGSPAMTIVRLGPWSRRTTGDDPEGYAGAVAAALWARASRLEPAPASTVVGMMTRWALVVPTAVFLVVVAVVLVALA